MVNVRGQNSNVVLNPQCEDTEESRCKQKDTTNGFRFLKFYGLLVDPHTKYISVMNPLKTVCVCFFSAQRFSGSDLNGGVVFVNTMISFLNR